MRDLLVGRDGKSAAVLVEYVSDPERPIEEVPALLDQVIQPVLDAGFTRQQLHLAGLVPESVEATDQARFSIARIFPATALVLIVVVRVVPRMLSKR